MTQNNTARAHLTHSFLAATFCTRDHVVGAGVTTVAFSSSTTYARFWVSLAELKRTVQFCNLTLSRSQCRLTA